MDCAAAFGVAMQLSHPSFSARRSGPEEGPVSICTAQFNSVDKHTLLAPGQDDEQKGGGGGYFYRAF